MNLLFNKIKCNKYTCNNMSNSSLAMTMRHLSDESTTKTIPWHSWKIMHHNNYMPCCSVTQNNFKDTNDNENHFTSFVPCNNLPKHFELFLLMKCHVNLFFHLLLEFSINVCIKHILSIVSFKTRKRNLRLM